MINPANVIEGTLSVFLLAALVYGPWQWIITDVARQRMFRGRDRLFDMALNGEMEFSSDEYRTIRGEINNLIRFAHGLTWPRVFLLAKLANRPSESQIPIYMAINNISDHEIREKVWKINKEIEFAAVQMILWKSPMLILLGTVTVIPITLFIISYLFAKDLLLAPAKEVGELIQSEASCLRS